MLSVNGGSNNRVTAVFELECDKGNSPQIGLHEIGLWKAVIYNPKAMEELSQNDYPRSVKAYVYSPTLGGWRNTPCPLEAAQDPEQCWGQ